MKLAPAAALATFLAAPAAALPFAFASATGSTTVAHGATAAGLTLLSFAPVEILDFGLADGAGGSAASAGGVFAAGGFAGLAESAALAQPAYGVHAATAGLEAAPLLRFVNEGAADAPLALRLAGSIDLSVQTAGRLAFANAFGTWTFRFAGTGVSGTLPASFGDSADLSGGFFTGPFGADSLSRAASLELALVLSPGAVLEIAQASFAASFAYAFVPEPATWAMLVAGFGIVGVALSRQRRPLSA